MCELVNFFLIQILASRDLHSAVLTIITIYQYYVRYKRRAYIHVISKLTATCHRYSTVRTSQLQTSMDVTFLGVKNLCICHRKWPGSNTSRKRMSLYTPVITTCRLHTEIFLCTTGHDIGCTVAHFKTLGSTILLSSMDHEISEIQG